MAFATTNVRKDAFGSLKVTAGQWSGAAGDASGSLGVEGGIVYLAAFSSQDGAGTQIQHPVTVIPSGTAGVVTLTVGNVSDVTAGRFLIVHQ